MSLQSHLYGIEICRIKCLMMLILRLQSHLYGIEIQSLFRTYYFAFTPIAPLWNWNEIETKYPLIDASTPIAPLWNWNITATNGKPVVKKTPIAPLWNWNIQSRRIWNRFWWLQSHLYGIEIRSGLKSLGDAFSTPIAPLWNWNWARKKKLR